MVHRVFVILVNSLAKDDKGIPDEQMSDVICECIVNAYELKLSMGRQASRIFEHTVAFQSLIDPFVDRAVDVVIRRLIP